jgi:hypothetical protein
MSDEDVEEFAEALQATIKGARRMPSSLTKLAFTAASAALSRR